MKENKMGTMPVNRLLISMSIPMIISMLVQALYNVVDSMFVAQVSENALTAVSLAFPYQNLMIASRPERESESTRCYPSHWAKTIKNLSIKPAATPCFSRLPAGRSSPFSGWRFAGPFFKCKPASRKSSMAARRIYAFAA